MNMVKLNRFWLALLLAFCCGSLPFASRAQSALALASKALAQGDYQQAANRYAQLHRAGYTGADLHYNWGYCLQRLGDLGPAVYHYELALLADPQHPGARSNLAATQAQLVDQIDETIELQWSDWLLHPEWQASLGQWWVLGTFGWILGWLAWGVAQWQQSWPYWRWLRWAGWLMLGLGIFGLGGYALSYRNLYLRPSGVVIVAEKKLFSAPETASKTQRVLHAGTKVWQEDQLQGWAQVRLSNGDSGWIQTGGIGWIR